MNSFFQSAFESKHEQSKVTDRSEYADNLSSEIIPMPSVLTDKSIG